MLSTEVMALEGVSVIHDHQTHVDILAVGFLLSPLGRGKGSEDGHGGTSRTGMPSCRPIRSHALLIHTESLVRTARALLTLSFPLNNTLRFLRHGGNTSHRCAALGIDCTVSSAWAEVGWATSCCPCVSSWRRCLTAPNFYRLTHFQPRLTSTVD